MDHVPPYGVLLPVSVHIGDRDEFPRSINARKITAANYDGVLQVPDRICTRQTVPPEQPPLVSGETSRLIDRKGLPGCSDDPRAATGGWVRRYSVADCSATAAARAPRDRDPGYIAGSGPGAATARRYGDRAASDAPAETLRRGRYG